MRAPPIVHQIWFQGWDKRPAKYDSNVEELRALNPEFEFRTWDDASIREECNRLGPEYLKKYDSLKYMISKIDFGRYVVLYNHGGISMDLDMRPLRPLRKTPHLDRQGFIVSNAAFLHGNLGIVNNAVFIVTPQHPVMKDVLEQMLRIDPDDSAYLTKDLYIHNSTGPVAIGRILAKHGDAVFYLDNTYFEPCMSVDPYCTVSDVSIADHQHELSWMSPILRLFSRAMFYVLHYWYILGMIVVVIWYWHFRVPKSK